MKIVLLSGASSIHTIRWANGLCSAGHDVHVITQQKACEAFLPEVIVHEFPSRGILGYFLIVPAVKKLIMNIKPDIVNAHYASGYATTARLVNYHPWILSVWGSDVYIFPYRSSIHKWLVKTNLYAADAVASTSNSMALQTRSIAPKLNQIPITPFGVDFDKFAKYSESSKIDKHKPIVIGTVKSLSDTYGIDLLIKSFALVYRKFLANDEGTANLLQLRIVGSGPKLKELEELAKNEGVSDITTFVGRVEHEQVPSELSKLDIYVALSRSESFGVAIIEAGATGKPVVVSDVGGLPEVVLDNQTGFIVPTEDPQAAAIKIEELVLNEELRLKIGKKGQLHVQNTYDWGVCLNLMKGVYDNVIQQANNK